MFMGNTKTLLIAKCYAGEGGNLHIFLIMRASPSEGISCVHFDYKLNTIVFQLIVGSLIYKL